MRFEHKVRIVTSLIFLGLALVFLRLALIQTVQSGPLSSEGDAEHFNILSIPARRGEIRAADDTALAADKNAFLLYAQLPKLPTNRKSVADKLTDLLAPQIPIVATDSSPLTPEAQTQMEKTVHDNLDHDLLARLDTQNAVWVNLAHFVSQNIHDQINSLNIAGLGFEDEQARDYPEASMAAQVLGFVGSDQNGNPQGYFGLEGFYQRELAGRPGQLRQEKDAFGNPIAIGSETRIEKRDGSDLITTIDRSVQLFVEAELSKGISDWQASGGTAIVMDPNTGAIVAMANFPAYDPANFSYYPGTLYKNPAVANLFEPGSIFKPIIMSAALNENVLTPDTHCDQCSGPRQIYNYYIHTFDNQYHPNETMTEVLVNSDNTGMVFVGEKLGFDKLYSYLQKFGFGQKTGVDLQEEEGGALRAKGDFYPIDKATVTFGQGINVNALQMVRAFGALANGGRLPIPYLVSRIIDNDKVVNVPHPLGPQIISPTVSKTISEMLIQVADNSPEHFPKDRLPELANFQIAGKSGTAQIAVGGSYQSAAGTIASMIGYFPALSPRFVILVKLNEPVVRPWGSDTAGPVFFAIVKDLINYYGITP
ncbi:MAG: penicillin-binding protein 2 [Patescibacteria group bacterium]|nr:penicillin-binding protein 2 [Patescibacteria group bacterium]MCL5431725.1 penicillin-binding protein 2 [Patescibacteria group bacterium]